MLVCVAPFCWLFVFKYILISIYCFYRLHGAVDLALPPKKGTKGLHDPVQHLALAKLDMQQ